jgi:uncharacterized membrane protein
MHAAPIAYRSPGEFLARAVAFGLLVVAGIAAIVLAGAWWAACIGAVGLLLAVAGLVVSVVALLGEERSSLRGASRPAAMALGAASAIAIVAALVAA